MKAQKIRYAIVGLGHIAQKAVMPGFRKAKNTELVAYVTGDVAKAKRITKVYRKAEIYTYDQYDELLSSGKIDAVYIALPNHLHYEYTKRALQKKIHVLCEKPFAMTPAECLELSRLADTQNTKLMVAYRLHFEAANLRAVEIAKSGKLGNLRYFSAIFSYNMKDKNNIRFKAEEGGTPVWDIGIYCLNAVRMLFREEPIEVFAQTGSTDQKRFSEAEEQISATLKFKDGKLATFVCSFGADAVADFSLYGAKGHLHLKNAFEYVGKRELTVHADHKTHKRTYKTCDQFGPEVEYFSTCIQKNHRPEPSGYEGLADVQIITAINQSLKTGKAVKIGSPADSRVVKNKRRPSLQQKMRKPAVHPFPVEEKS